MFAITASRRIACALLVILAAGCASPPSLDHAELKEVTLASPDDLTRLNRAQELWERESFGYVSFSDGRGNILASFEGEEEYDDYLAYLRKQGKSTPTEVREWRQRKGPHWPQMRITFQSTHSLFEQPVWFIEFYNCGKTDDFWEWDSLHFGNPKIMWRNRIVDTEVSREIEEILETGGKPQTYEMFFKYVHSNREDYLRNGTPPVLLPLSDDLCISFTIRDILLGVGVGRPFRIDGNLVNAAVGDLPRPRPQP